MLTLTIMFLFVVFLLGLFCWKDKQGLKYRWHSWPSHRVSFGLALALATEGTLSLFMVRWGGRAELADTFFFTWIACMSGTISIILLAVSVLQYLTNKKPGDKIVRW